MSIIFHHALLHCLSSNVAKCTADFNPKILHFTDASLRICVHMCCIDHIIYMFPSVVSRIKICWICSKTGEYCLIYFYSYKIAKVKNL